MIGLAIFVTALSLLIIFLGLVMFFDRIDRKLSPRSWHAENWPTPPKS